MKTIITQLTFLLFLPCMLLSQHDTNTAKHPISLKAQIGHQRIGLPFRKMATSPYHFSTGIGIERVWKAKAKSTSYQTLDITYFQNASSGNGYYVSLNIGRRFHLPKSFFLSGEAGVGIIHIFRPNSVYDLKDNGTYAQVKDRGKIHPTVGISFQTGYQLNKLGLFLAYHILSEFLYNEDAIVYPQTFLSLGIRYKI
ncbi:MAG: hypothetical protein MI974_20035 [Chitinophagales bacterium]|nr:hypothetical protein [Chitinophagales bacterium]